MQTTILWYDLETFGLDVRYDRIAQFAAQRTDMDLRPLGDPIVLYGKLSDDYLPDPQSCMVTGITPQQTAEKGLCEYDLVKKINELFSTPGTIVAGFNNIHFDDEMVRSALYRNFFDPYEREWKNGCSRWDIIDMVRAAHDLRPDGIAWPQATTESGAPSIKLTNLTDANRIDQTGAHDAMVDVRATIAVARLIKEKQPKLFEWSLKHRTKQAVKNLVTTPFGAPFLYTAARFSNPHGFSALVVPITPSKDVANTIICFDLSKDPTKLLSFKGGSIRDVDGVCTISLNRCPFVTPVNKSFPDDATFARLGIDRAKCRESYRILYDHPEVIPVLRDSLSDEERGDVEDTDFQIYSGGFFSDLDKAGFAVIQKTAPEQKLSLHLRFQDKRVPEMLFRHVARNWPQVLSVEEKARWKSFCASRILSPPGGVMINWDFYNRKIKEKMESTEISPQLKKDVLSPLAAYGKALGERLFGKES